ncbi:hypothetical protein AXG93_4554s1010 [Marchantia polymorpha subsp. ruderalis]|uniref:Uncharacterized protein n=1 Tax=Marchantia polymorpha subsp. ruderalis TaxID=1480154 RepID=A0A176WTY6_MARPO|nr:hypothetical protein AXG93_4554s1010 [Marchantia polymorpha subsp. ruderalis]
MAKWKANRGEMEEAILDRQYAKVPHVTKGGSRGRREKHEEKHFQGGRHSFKHRLNSSAVKNYGSQYDVDQFKYSTIKLETGFWLKATLSDLT